MVWHRSKQFTARPDASRSLFGIVIAAAIALVLNGCSNKDTPAHATEVKPAKSAPAAPVIVAEVTRQTMPLRA
jgi:PBP1b-binding outer membrane lipoprotein LpoB